MNELEYHERISPDEYVYVLIAGSYNRLLQSNSDWFIFSE